MFHVKNAEFGPTGRLGRLSAMGRPYRTLRSPGDGKIDFGTVCPNMAAHDFDGWAVVEWERAPGHVVDGARVGEQLVRKHVNRMTGRAFGDVAAGNTDEAANRAMQGIS